MHKRFKALLLGNSIAVFLLGTYPALADLYVNEGFESNSIAGYEQETQGSGSFRIITGGGAREGSRYLSITKNRGSSRYELRFEQHPKPSDRWYGFSMRLPSNLPNTNEGYLVGQWHVFPDPGEAWHIPDSSINMNPDYRLTLRNAWDSRRITPRNSTNIGRRSVPLLTMNRGNWYDFVVRYRYSYNNDGLIEIYAARAGSQLQLLQRLTGPNSFNDARGQFRLGPYCAEDDFEITIEVDAIRVGDSLDEVRPR